MSAKERSRMVVLSQVKTGELSLVDVAEKMGVCYRQARRIYRRFRDQGAVGLVHRSRGRVSNRKTSPGLKACALELYRAHYADYGPTLASEVLDEQHGLSVHPETLRRWLHAEGLLLPKVAARKHRRRRERRGHFGELLQVDGSDHDWFEGRRAKCCLMVAVDDATGKSAALFAEQETLEAAYGLARKWIVRHGVPEAIYADKKNVYHGGRNYFCKDRQPHEPAGDFERACEELGVRLIAAHSPQAKGRVERKNGVLQDRLIKELRRRKINTIGEANAALDAILEKLDQKFAVAPREPVDRHRKRPGDEVLNRILSREQTRIVQSDWTISWNGQALQILKQDYQPRPRDRVTIRTCFDGTLEITHQKQILKWEKVKYQNLFSSPSPGRGMKNNKHKRTT